MAEGGWWKRTWTWLAPWLEQLVWMNPDVACFYLSWRLTEDGERQRHVEVLKVA